jgi:MFS family permease
LPDIIITGLFEANAEEIYMKATAQPKAARKKIYYGWWIVLVTGLVTGLGSGFYYYGISVFFKDITAELGTSRAITSLGSSIGRLEGGIISPLTGWLGDKFGPRWIIFAGVCLVSIGLGVMYTITSIWTYFIAWGLITGLGMNLGMTVAVDLALTNWFVRKRGLAMGIKFLLIGVGSIIAIPLTAWLVNYVGWRVTCLIWSITMLVSIPILLLVVKNKRPEYYGLLPDGAQAETQEDSSQDNVIEQGIKYASDVQENDFTFKQAVKTRPYWVIAMAYALFSFVIGGFVIHSVPLMTDIGLSEAAASGMISLMVFFTLPLRFFGGVIADRIRKNHLRFLLAAIFALMLVGLAGFLVKPVSSRILFLLIPYGLSSGAVTPIVILLIGRYFGRKAFGSIFGSCMLFNAIPQLISPVYAGWIFDISGSYITALTVFAALVAASAIVICFAVAPKAPAPALDTGI